MIAGIHLIRPRRRKIVTAQPFPFRSHIIDSITAQQYSEEAMITNEHQYRITKAEAQQFEEALRQSDAQSSELHPLLRQAMREGLESQFRELQEQIAE